MRNNRLVIILIFISVAIAFSLEKREITINTKDYLIVSEVISLEKPRRDKKVKEKFDEEKNLSTIVFNSKGKAKIKSEKRKNIDSKNLVLHGSTKYYKRREHKNLLVKEMTYNYGSLNGEVRYYDENGKLTEIECYLNGVIEGFQIEFNEDGTESKRDLIIDGIKVN